MEDTGTQYIFRVPGREQREDRGRRQYPKEIMAEKIPEQIEDTDPQIQMPNKSQARQIKRNL